MQAIRTGRWAALLASTALVAANTTVAARAQATTAETAPADEEILVTGIRQQFQPEIAASATGFDLPIIETPQAVSVFNQDMIKVTGASTLAEYATYIPGVDKYQDFGGSSAKFQARGFRISALRGLKVNGVSFYNNQLDPFFVERVEFVRGPTSIVFGNNGFGGIINTVTKKPEADFFATVGAEAGMFDFYRGDLDVNVPLGENVGARFVAGYEEGGDFIRGLDRDALFFAPTLQFQPTPQTTLTVTGAIQRRDEQPSDQYTAVTSANGDLFLDRSLSRRNFIGVDWARAERDFDFLQATARHELSDAVYTKLSYGYSRSDFPTTYAFAYGPASPSGDAALYAYQANEDVALHVVEASVGGEFEAFGQTNEFLLAAQHDNLRFKGDNFSSFSIGTINLYNPETDFDEPDFGDPTNLSRARQKNYSLSAQAVIRPVERLSLLLGARYDDGKSIDKSSFTTPDRRKNPYDALTLRAGASLEVATDINVYLSYSEGFEPRLFAARTLQGAVAEPEEGVQYEGGLKGKLFDGRATFSAAAFHITREKIAESIRGNPGFVRLTGEQEHKGAEFEIVGEPIRGLNIIGAYAYIDTEITKNLSRPALVGNQQGNVPKHAASVYLSYAPQSGALAGFALAGGVRYEGKRFVSTDNDVRLPGYAIANASLLYEWNKRLTLRLTVDNIFDKYYYEPYYNTSLYGLAHGRPRELSARLGYRF